MKTIRLAGGGTIAVFPSEVEVFNFTAADADTLAQVLTENPVVPVTFLATKFDRSVFSQAETRNRSFIFAEQFIPRSAVDEVYPVQWLAEGDIIPQTPGGIEIVATPSGFTANGTQL